MSLDLAYVRRSVVEEALAGGAMTGALAAAIRRFLDQPAQFMTSALYSEQPGRLNDLYALCAQHGAVQGEPTPWLTVYHERLMAAARTADLDASWEMVRPSSVFVPPHQLPPLPTGDAPGAALRIRPARLDITIDADRARAGDDRIRIEMALPVLVLRQQGAVASTPPGRARRTSR